MIKFDGYDNAIIGTALVWHPDGTREDTVVYNGESIADVLVSRDGMTHEEAVEYIEFNMEGGYVGPDTPIIVWHDADFFEDN